MLIQKQCIMCGKNHVIKMEERAYILWNRGEHIQDVAPELTTDERELLISGICGECFDNMFSEEEE